MSLNNISLNDKNKLWNDAVIATLVEMRKYDGIIRMDHIDYMTDQIFKKVSKKIDRQKPTHNFKKLQY